MAALVAAIAPQRAAVTCTEVIAMSDLHFESGDIPISASRIVFSPQGARNIARDCR